MYSKKRVNVEPNHILINATKDKSSLPWSRPQSNRRPSMCKTDVITTYTTRSHEAWYCHHLISLFVTMLTISYIVWKGSWW